jgi:dUTP pyrophosphatase
MKNNYFTKNDYNFDILDSLFMILPPHSHLIPGNNRINLCRLTNITNTLILHPDFYTPWSPHFHNFAAVGKNTNHSPAFANSSFYTVKPTTATHITTTKSWEQVVPSSRFFANNPLNLFIKYHEVYNPEIAPHEHDTAIIDTHHDQATALIVRLDNFIKLPFQATPDSSGFDVHSTISTSILPGNRKQIPLGIKVCPPEGCYTRNTSRSSLALHHCFFVNGGVIDHGYTGEMHALLINISHHMVSISHEDRIGQLIFGKKIHPYDHGKRWSPVHYPLW